MSKEENYLRDVTCELKANALSIKSQRDKVRDTEDHSYESGRLMAYHEVISLLIDQAKQFGVLLPELNDIEPDRDLL